MEHMHESVRQARLVDPLSAGGDKGQPQHGHEVQAGHVKHLDRAVL